MPDAEDVEAYSEEKLADRHRLAAEIVALLPEDREDAEAVLELAETILWIVPQPPAGLPGRLSA
jgi:hypothetical protein